MKWFAYVFTVVAGAFISIQAGSNTQLKKAFGDPMPAVGVNYLLGVTSVLAYSLATKVSTPTLQQPRRRRGGVGSVVCSVSSMVLRPWSWEVRWGRRH